jgi:hypothetical protein
VAKPPQVGCPCYRGKLKGEFGEDFRYPMPRIDIKTEFVVAAVEILDECVSCADYSR